ncbi:DndE family protein [Croceitalea marina]|uniref:DndE family protein n=1 Tax=Croceitalea marina TaxID=1775166 RepID=A0ABW5MUK9_9FLAO
MSTFTHIRTSSANKLRVTELTRRLQLGPENVIARIALTYSLSKNEKLDLNNIQNSSGKEYRQSVLFGNYTQNYIALICSHYGLYRTDKDIPKYIKMHIDHGLELIDDEIQNNPNLNGFDFLVDKIDEGLKTM